MGKGPLVNRREFLGGALGISAQLLGKAPASADQAIEPSAAGQQHPFGGEGGSLIRIPKAGASVAGLGETFSTDPFTGTEGISVPLGITAGRDGYGPKHGLRYSTAHGNGSFGLGWGLDIPALQRRTQGRLPRYDDSDIIVLGANELIPAGAPARRGRFEVRNYIQRHEESFPRIELWRAVGGSPRGLVSTFWRLTTRDNVTSWFGPTEDSVLADPDDPERIFRWSIKLSGDGKGNCIEYQYKPDRSDRNARCQLYPKRIRYGNLSPIDAGDLMAVLAYLHGDGQSRAALFEVVFDYGEHGAQENGSQLVSEDVYRERAEWPARPDPIVSFRSGFEISTWRLCRRVLMFHRQPDAAPELVSSTDFRYENQPVTETTTLTAVTGRRFRRSSPEAVAFSEDYDPERGLGVKCIGYDVATLPPLDFAYSVFERPTADDVRRIHGSGRSAPSQGLSDKRVSFVDLFGRGLPDILETQRGSYRYWKNLGDGSFEEARILQRSPPGIVLGDPGVGMSNLTQHPFPEILLMRANRLAYCRATLPEPGSGEPVGWGSPEPVAEVPAGLDTRNRRLRLADLTGDGRLDALLDALDRFVVFECLGEKGYRWAGERPRITDLSSPWVRLADMTGDGLDDIVLISPTDQQVHYWPNLGHGNFGPRRTMRNTPELPLDSKLVFLADADGSGPADLISVRSGRVDYCLNRSGVSWSQRVTVEGTPPVGPRLAPRVVDLLGDGTRCVVWGGVGGFQAYRYLPLGRNKPGLLKATRSGSGSRTTYQYRTSTAFHREAEAAGTPWRTWLPSPVYVVSRVERKDEVGGTRLVSKLSYAHGGFDEERAQFIGFGRVEKWDTETEAGVPASPPVRSRSWFHVGVPHSMSSDGNLLADEYSKAAGQPRLAATDLPSDVSKEERWEVLRGLRGRPLRVEIFAEDGSFEAPHPYSITENRYRTRRVRDAFHSYRLESLGAHCERKPDDPRLTHELVLDVDAFGNVLEEASLAYPRGAHNRKTEQARGFATVTRRRFGAQVAHPRGYRHGMLVEESELELTGVPLGLGLLTADRLREGIRAATEIPFEQAATHRRPELRLLGRNRTYYWNDAVTSALPLGQVGLVGLTHSTRQLAFTGPILRRLYGSRVSDRVLAEAGYVRDGGPDWWLPSGHAIRGEAQYDPAFFYRKTRIIDPFGAETLLSYDTHSLLLTEVLDPTGSRTRATYDLRLQLPTMVEDPNGNRSAAAYDTLGVLIASASMGKAGEDVGDSLQGLEARPDPALVRRALTSDEAARRLLGKATTRVLYDPWGRYRLTEGPPGTAGSPLWTWNISRDRHTHGSRPGAPQIQHSIRYVDSFGRAVQIKTGRVPAPGSDPESPQRKVWAVDGRRVFDNKGNVIRRFDPFFSPTSAFEPKSEGAPVRFEYDPIGRLLRTEWPDGSVASTRFDAWTQEEWDQNDTLDEDNVWYRTRSAASRDQRAAAEAAIAHAGTPRILHLDPLGREVLEEEDNGAAGKLLTSTRFDIRGDVLERTDPRGNVSVSAAYDLAGRRLRTTSDCGTQLILPDAGGQPVRRWDEAGHEVSLEYDVLRRLTRTSVRSPEGVERVVLLRVYGESAPGSRSANLRGKVHKEYDSAGLVINERYDFKGNLIRSRRTLAKDPEPDWGELENAGEDRLLDAALTFPCEWDFDAHNRILSTVQPDGSRARRTYDPLGQLRRLQVRGPGDAGWTDVLRGGDFGPRGEPLELRQGNGITTRFEYDPYNLRLKRRWAFRAQDSTVVEDHRFEYDAVGNPITISDLSQEPLVRSNGVVEPRIECSYDPLYRLISCAGREHPGQSASEEVPVRPPRAGAHPADARGLVRYKEEFTYDEAGNLVEVVHRNPFGAWRRVHAYASTGNRLSSVTVPADGNGGTAPLRWNVEHDANGNIAHTPSLPQLHWTHERRLAGAVLGHAGNGDRAWYSYSVSGNRIRKVVRRGATVDERIQLGDFEIFIRRRGGSVVLRRHTLQLLIDDFTRLALYERIVESSTSPEEGSQRLRYELAHPNGSVLAEFDEGGGMISREEFHAFGTTAYYSGTGGRLSLSKRYRYCGKEKDEETGFYYFGARYYAPTIARWTSPDPLGHADTLNEYAFARNGPLRFRDTDGLQTGDTAAEGDPSRGWPIERTSESTTYWGVKLSTGQGHTTFEFNKGSTIIGRGGSRGGGSGARGGSSDASSNTTAGADSASSSGGGGAKRSSKGTQGPKAGSEGGGADSGDRKTGVLTAFRTYSLVATNGSLVRESYTAGASHIAEKSISDFAEKGGKLTLGQAEGIARKAFQSRSALRGQMQSKLDPLTKGASRLIEKGRTFEGQVAKAMENVDPKVVGQGQRRLEALKDVAVSAGKTNRTVNAAAQAFKALNLPVSVVTGSFAAEGLINDIQSGDVASGIGNALGVGSSVLAVAAAGAGWTALGAVGAVVGAAGVGYAVGTALREKVVEPATDFIDRLEIGSGPFGEWCYQTFMR